MNQQVVEDPATTKNEGLSYTAVWINLQRIVQSERRQTQTVKHGISKNLQNNAYYEQTKPELKKEKKHFTPK